MRFMETPASGVGASSSLFTSLRNLRNSGTSKEVPGSVPPPNVSSFLRVLSASVVRLLKKPSTAARFAEASPRVEM